MKKSFNCLLIAILILMVLAIPAAANDQDDIILSVDDPDHIAKSGEGYPDGNFKPDQLISKPEILCIMQKTLEAYSQFSSK